VGLLKGLFDRISIGSKHKGTAVLVMPLHIETRGSHSEVANGIVYVACDAGSRSGRLRQRHLFRVAPRRADQSVDLQGE
jgi:hypothetical protein